MKRIKRLSKILRGMCIVGLILVPLWHATCPVLAGSSDFSIRSDHLKIGVRLLGSEQLLQKAFNVALDPAATVLAMIGLYLLTRLFGLYSQGQVFTREDVSALRRIGYFLVVWLAFGQIGRLLKVPLQTESLIDASAQAIAFGIETAVAICYAVLVFLLIWIMADGRRLANMQQGINTGRIGRVSGILRLACLVALVLSPVAEVLYWGHVEYWRALHVNDFTGPWPTVADKLPMSELTKVVGFVARLFPLIVIMIALAFLSKLLSLVSRGEAFSSAAARCARAIGYAIIIGQILRPFYDSLTTVAFSLNAPPDIKAGSIGFGASNLSYITFGLMVLLLSRILYEGRELKEWPQEYAEIC
ncbi:MAG: DUF2975 domain-containing protein [Deltaproteobacteria bacterium]|nr:DUF2975 domain-containing protein [Deltaproteobacteria bacterium]